MQIFARHIKAALLKRLELRYWLSCYSAINQILGKPMKCMQKGAVEFINA
jgi:hypothetical protein